MKITEGKQVIQILDGNVVCSRVHIHVDKLSFGSFFFFYKLAFLIIVFSFFHLFACLFL